MYLDVCAGMLWMCTSCYQRIRWKPSLLTKLNRVERVCVEQWRLIIVIYVQQRMGAGYNLRQCYLQIITS